MGYEKKSPCLDERGKGCFAVAFARQLCRATRWMIPHAAWAAGEADAASGSAATSLSAALLDVL
jgi:hypothetical protein